MSKIYKFLKEPDSPVCLGTSDGGDAFRRDLLSALEYAHEMKVTYIIQHDKYGELEDVFDARIKRTKLINSGSQIGKKLQNL